ncbi:MAG: respiratory nitrate reductase subunit gamma [Thermoplasmata archaeon]
MNEISIILITYFYISIVIFLGGTIYHILAWIFSRKGLTDTYLGFPYLFTYPGQNSRLDALKNILKRVFLFSSMRYDRGTRIMSLLFHYSLWIIILAHFDLFLEPYLVSMGIAQSTIENISFIAGNLLGAIFIISGSYLLFRRIDNIYLRRISNADDYISMVLLLSFGVTGILIRILLPPYFAYQEVGPFISSLFLLHPSSIPIAPVFLVHFTLACTLVIYIPLSKLLHPFSFFTNPTLYTIFHER